LPRDVTVNGPGQVQNQFRSDTEAQKVLNILRTGETDVINGNLLTLPVGGGLLYVQPVYVKSHTGTQFPLLQKVFVSFGDKVGFADTLSGALDQVFGDGVVSNPNTGTPTPTPSPTPTPTPTPANPAGGESRAALAQALSDAQKAIQDGQNALAKGDFAAYGDAQDALKKALARAIDAEAKLDGTASTGAAIPTPKPTATPSKAAAAPANA
jgi:uncharacterized membrane protein (UPF0182 family)